MPAGENLPVVGVGAVVIHEGRVLLIRRGKDPLRGRWVVPGGRLEWGERLAEAAVRELAEETGVTGAPEEMLGTFDRIEGREGRITHHYVIVDFLCRYVDGVARAGSDAEALAWATPGELEAFDLPDKALEVVKDAFRRVYEKSLLPKSDPRSMLK
jgi:ADP-ribose pyrophosphatase YjhB (NUDIX family)